MPVNYPYIAVVTMDAAINIFIVAEKVVLCKAASISVAIKLLLASFYVFNIEYPKLLGGVLYFFEYYLYNIRSRKNLPIAVIQLCNQLCDQFGSFHLLQVWYIALICYRFGSFHLLQVSLYFLLIIVLQHPLPLCLLKAGSRIFFSSHGFISRSLNKKHRSS